MLKNDETQRVKILFELVSFFAHELTRLSRIQPATISLYPAVQKFAVQCVKVICL